MVKSYGQSWLTGSYPTYWTPIVTSNFYRGGYLALGPTTATGASGGTAEVDFNSNLQLSGVGSYEVTSSHSFSSTVCQGFNIGGSVGNVLAIARPVISRGAIPYFLGGADQANDYSRDTSLTVNSNGAPETPIWSFNAGSSFGQLACNQCLSGQSFTATKAASGCGAYDVVIKATFNGFDSDPFYIDIHQPNLLQHVRTDEGQPAQGGWNSLELYRVIDDCSAQMTNVNANEVFTSWQAYNGANWPAPLQADGFSDLIFDSPTSSWLLRDSLYEIPTESPNPIYTGSNSYDESSASLMTLHTQKWRIGSTYNGGPGGIPSVSSGPTQGSDTSAGGVLVQTNQHYHFLDHGNHGIQ